MKQTGVSIDWVLNALSGQKFPEQGGAYDFIKAAYAAATDSKAASETPTPSENVPGNQITSFSPTIQTQI